MSIPQMYLYNSFADWVTVTNSIANGFGDLVLFSGQNVGQTDVIHALNNLDVLKYDKVGGAISAWMTIGTTLGVTGATTLTGLLTANGNITLGTNVITLNSISGNAAFAGTMSIAGATTLAACSSTSLNVSGIGSIGSTLNVVGNLSVATNKFVVTAASGNTSIAGTLSVTGSTSLLSTVNSVGDLSVATNKFVVTAASGNTSIAGTLSVTGITTVLSSIVSTLGTTTTNVPILSATQTWNNSGTTFNGLVVNITNTASAAGSLLLAFQQGGMTTFGVTTGGTINQQTTISNLARTIISNVGEFRSIREYQDLNDGLAVGTQGLDVNSVTEWSDTFNARWDSLTLSYVKDRSNNSAGIDHAYMSRLTEDFKQQWWFSDGTSIGSAISWVKRIDLDMAASAYTFNGTLTTGTLNTSNLITTGAVTIGSATLFADYIITTTTATTTVLATIDNTLYRSMSFDIQAFDATSGKYSKASISAIHNGSIVDFVEYGAVAVAGVCGAYSVTLSGTSVFLNVLPASANSTVFKVHTVLIKI